MLDPPRLTADSDRSDDGLRSGPADRHNGAASFVFADGHVATMTPEKAGYRRVDGGRYVVEAAGGDDQRAPHNTLFSGSGSDDDPPPTSDK